MQEENKVMTKAIPSGFSSFEEIRTNDYCYVDKTMMIKELLYPRPNKVSLITRPRRFGKTLNMSMLECFLDIHRKEEHLFDGLKIMDEQKICNEFMHAYPVIHVSFKDVNCDGSESKNENLKSVIESLKTTIGELVNNSNSSKIARN